MNAITRRISATLDEVRRTVGFPRATIYAVLALLFMASLISGVNPILNGVSYIFGSLSGLSLEALAIITGLTVIAFIIDCVFAGWKQSALSRLLQPDASCRRDLYCFFAYNSPVFTVVSTVLTLGVVSYYADLTGRYLHLNLLDEIDSTSPQIGILILFHNFFHYWTHRLVHILEPLWELHKYHHSATELNIITNFRTHPVEGALANAFTAAPFALLGGDVEYFVYVGYFFAIHTMIIHSSIDYDFGFVGRWILVSPLHHRLHHSIDPRHYNCNFGTVTPIYDRIFGTYGVPEKRSAIIVGIDDNRYNREDFVRGIWQGWKRCCVLLFLPDSARND